MMLAPPLSAIYVLPRVDGPFGGKKLSPCRLRQGKPLSNSIAQLVNPVRSVQQSSEPATYHVTLSKGYLILRPSYLKTILIVNC